MTMPSSFPPGHVQAAWKQLVDEIRTGVLLTMRHGRPFGSHVPFLVGENWTRLYIHISRLALHTQHLLETPQVSLFVSETDRPEKNPLALKRCNLQGQAMILAAQHADHAKIKERYVERFPQSAMLFGFSDFQLWELRIEEAHFVLGFGHAYLAHAFSPLDWIHQKPEKSGSSI